MIVLNVGGTRHCTSRETLMRKAPHFLSNLCDYAHDTEIFIDRNGVLFGLVLDYLRSGSLPVCDDLLHRLTYEADFFCIEAMKTDLARQVGVVSELSERLTTMMRRL